MIPCAFLPLLLAIPATEMPPTSLLLQDVPAEESVNTGAWKGSVTAGAIKTTGNSETDSASVTADAGWKTKKEAVSLNFSWNYQSSETDGVSSITQRKVFGKGQYDRFMSAKTYAYGNASGEHDFTAALDLRTTYGLGLGHDFRDDKQWAISGEVGASYIEEDYTLNTADAEYVAARLAYNTEYKGSKRFAFNHDGEIFPSLEDSDDVTARWDTRVKTNLTDTMFAQLQWVLTYDNTPVTGLDRQDHLLALTIGWTF